MVLDTLDGFFMVINADAVVECVTPNVTKYLGVSTGDIVNRSLYSFLSPSSHQCFVQLLSTHDGLRSVTGAF